MAAADYIARALGTMGESELLQAALGATDRQFYRSNTVAVQSAALEGMAFMPSSAEPLKMLQALLRRANKATLRQAVADAICTALQRRAV